MTDYLTDRDTGDETDPRDQPCPCGLVGMCLRQHPWREATRYPVCPDLPAEGVPD